jgi:hypothetical protein
MLIVRILILTLLVSFTLNGRAAAQSLSVTGGRIELPDGDVIGAAFYEDMDTVIVQQSVISTENGGLVFRSHRQLTSWSMKSRLQLAKSEFGLSPSGSSTHPCGRVEVVPALTRVYICSAETNLEILDAKSLKTTGSIAAGSNQRIYDFAIDEQRGKVFVLSLRSDMSVRLAAYSLTTGIALQEITLSQTAWGGPEMALEPKTGRVAVTEWHESGHQYASNITLCESTSSRSCTNLGSVDPVAQMTFLGRTILFATSNPANNKKDCIGSLNVSTRAVSHDYCSPSTGVHFAVGVILNKYIVGFTGTTKTHAFLERNSSRQSSFSIWRAENPKVEAVVKDPTDYGASQFELRIVASKTTAMFLTYALGSNTLSLYSIKDTE